MSWILLTQKALKGNKDGIGLKNFWRDSENQA